MLNLLPIRVLVRGVIILATVPVILAIGLGALGAGNALNTAIGIIRYSYIAAFAVIILPSVAWRSLPWLQSWIFPYLGGEWEGEIEFGAEDGPEIRLVHLDIEHTLFNITLILRSAESISRTLVVHPERDRGLRSDRLYYVYRNERKEGVPNAGESYRGLAVLGVDSSRPRQLLGTYFTERQRHGLLRLKQTRRYPGWVVWK